MPEVSVVATCFSCAQQSCISLLQSQHRFCNSSGLVKRMAADLGACEAGVSLPLCCTKLELSCVICFCSACYQQRLASRPIAQQLWLGPDSVRKHAIVGSSFADVLQTLHRYTCSRYTILKESYKTNGQVAVWRRASSHAPERQA